MGDLLNQITSTDAPTIMLIPYHLLRTNIDTITSIYAHRTPTHIIADESTAIKHSSTQTAKAAINLSCLFAATPRLILTGDPKPESPIEIWSQFQFAYGSHNPLGSTYYKFLKRWFVRHDYGWSLRSDLYDQFYATIETNSTWLTLDEAINIHAVTDKPYEQYVVEQYEQTDQQRHLLDVLFGEWCLADAQGRDVNFSYTMQVYMKAQQIASGFYYMPIPDGNGNEIITLASQPKVDLLIDVIDSLLQEWRSSTTPRKIVVWHKFRAEQQILIPALSKYGLLVGPDEDAIITFMQDPDIHVILMPVDVGTSLNELSDAGADVNIFYSNDPSQEKRNQCEARLARVGNKHSMVLHIDLCSDQMRDADIVTALQSKCLTPARIATVYSREHAHYGLNLEQRKIYHVTNKKTQSNGSGSGSESGNRSNHGIGSSIASRDCTDRSGGPDAPPDKRGRRQK
jgi:hypothetical protein